MSTRSVSSFFDREVKSQLTLNFDRSSIEQVRAKAEGFQRFLAGLNKDTIAFGRHARCYLRYLPGFIDFDLENYVALNSFFQRFVGIYRHGFMFDRAKHHCVRDVNARTGRRSLVRGSLP